MGLLTPSGGLLFWMTLAFAVVFLVLAKFAFPAILGSMQKRSSYIDMQLDAAREAEKSLASLNEERERIVSDAQQKKISILCDAAAEKDRILSQARDEARAESARIIAEAKQSAELQKEQILASARGEVAIIAVQMAGKVLRGNLNTEAAQQTLQNTLANEI